MLWPVVLDTQVPWSLHMVHYCIYYYLALILLYTTNNQSYSINTVVCGLQISSYSLTRQVCMWTRLWIRMQEFPQSLIGQHAKIYLLLSNPEIAAELRAYICSNKWVMDLEKLSKFLKDQLVPKAAEEYLHLITKEEMPQGLKKYMELELFPHIHLRVGCGISLAAA